MPRKPVVALIRIFADRNRVWRWVTFDADRQVIERSDDGWETKAQARKAAKDHAPDVKLEVWEPVPDDSDAAA